jgi:hypothetical protein
MNERRQAGAVPTVCPSCSTDLLPHARKCGCGWVVRATSSRSSEPGTSYPTVSATLCAWHGGCKRVGSLSNEGFGENRRWFCSEHFPPFEAWRTKAARPPNGFEAVRAQLKRMRPRTIRAVAAEALDPESLAERRAIQDESDAP